MTTAHHVKRARKTNPVAAKGEPYWWWKQRLGAKQYSKTEPYRSQLTTDEFWKGAYYLLDEFDWGGGEDLKSRTLRYRELLLDLVDMLDERKTGCPPHLAIAKQLYDERIKSIEKWIVKVYTISRTAMNDSQKVSAFKAIQYEGDRDDG